MAAAALRLPFAVTPRWRRGGPEPGAAPEAWWRWRKGTRSERRPGSALPPLYHNRAALRGQVRGGGAQRGRPGARWGPPGCGRPGLAWRRCPEACGLTGPEGSAAWGGAKSAPNQPLAPGQRPSKLGSPGWSCSSLSSGLGELGRPRLCPPAAGQALSVRSGGRGASKARCRCAAPREVS